MTWTVQASLGSPDDGDITYSVERQLGAGSWAALVSGGCSSALPHGTASCTDTPPGSGSYRYRAVATFHSWTATSNVAGPVVIATDSDPPVNAITLSGVSGGAFKSGATVFYRGAAAGSFALTNAVSDSDSGPASSATAALSGTSTGWTHSPSLVSTPAGGPYVSNVFSWSAATSSSPGETVTGRDVAANTAATALTFTDDSTGPAGGSVDATGLVGAGGRYSTATGLSIAFGAGTDAGSGLATGKQLMRATASLAADGSCGTYGTYTQVGADDPVSPVVNSVSAGEACYRYQYVVADTVGNATTYTSPDIKVDTVAPASPTVVSLTNGGGTANAYINTANKASVNFSVTLGASSSSSNTINFSIADAGSAHVLTPTTAATSGAGSVTFNAQVLTAFNDGTITVGATSTDLAGNSSTATTITPTKDTVAPASPTAVSLTNGGGTGSAYINTANKASVNFSVTLGASSSSSDTIALNIADAGSAHVLTPTPVAAPSGAGSVTFNGQVLTAFNDGTITVGATASDLAGNSSSATTITPTKDTAAPADPTAVTMTNGSGAGSAYISKVNWVSVGYSVVNVGNAAGDTIWVTLTSSGGGSPASGSTVRGASSPTAVSLSAVTSPADGTVTATAKATDAAGNDSAGTATTTGPKDTVQPANSTSITMTNGLGVGNAYINTVNRASTNFTVTLAASSLSSDTITFKIRDLSNAHIITATPVAGTSGAGSVTFNGHDVTALDEGFTQITTSIFDVAGNSSGTATVSRMQDTIAPSATDIQSANKVGGLIGFPQAGDQTFYTFSEPMNSASLSASWTGTSKTVAAPLVYAAGPPIKNTLTITSSNFGAVVAPLGGYTTGSVSNGSSTIVMSGSVVTLTWAGAGGSSQQNTTIDHNLVWTPSATATDLAGNAMSVTPRTQTGAAKKQW